MAVLVGIDEAGYGPLLGPLVVSAAAFKVPDSQLKSDMWETLEKAVGKAKRGLSGRILITDSKKAYTKSSGISYLKRSVLAGIHAAHGEKKYGRTVADLLEVVCPKCFKRLGEYPWYGNLRDHSLEAEGGDIDIAAGVFSRTLTDNGMSVAAVTARCLDVGYYNSQVEIVKNKSNVLFSSICGIIAEIFRPVPEDQTVQIIVDRQGGRINYTPSLMRMFPEMELKELKRTPVLSSYELFSKKKKMRLHFAAKADQHWLPVSLASMTSKYVRELMVDAINRYFTGFCGEIKPTAGYWQDGRRFIKDINESIPELKYDPKMLIRCR